MIFQSGRLIFNLLTCTSIVLPVSVNCGESLGLDYEHGNNSSYEYDEESTVERLGADQESQAPGGPEVIGEAPAYGANDDFDPLKSPMGDHFNSPLGADIRMTGRPRIVPLFDKDGKRITSDEVFADVQKRKIEKMYYDSEGRRVTIPFLLRDEDFREANLTCLLNWIEWLDDMKTTLLDMKEKASSCKAHSNEEVKGYDSVSVMMKDLQDGLQMVDEYDKKLNDQLRHPSKQWNYPEGNQPTAR